MRVLAVTPWFPSRDAPGAGIFNLRDAGLLAQEHDVTVLHLIAPHMRSSRDLPEETLADGIRVRRIPFTTSNLRLLNSAVHAIKEEAEGAELLHTMAMPALLPASMARTHLPWVHTEHYSRLVTPPGSWRTALSLGVLKRLFRFPTETVAVSESLASVIDRYRGRPSTVIGNEVMHPVDPLPNTRNASTRFRMIGVGSLIARKGPNIAVETLAELVRRGDDAELAWVGEGELRESMIELAEARGLCGRLSLLGHLSPDELSRELLSSDLFLLPVETETFGVAIAEALTHGLPVVATGKGGHEEFMPPTWSRLVRERAAGPLADAVQELRRDCSGVDRSVIADQARARFSDDVRREAYLGVYERAVRTSRSRK